MGKQRQFNTYDLLKFYGISLTIIDHLAWDYVVRDRDVNLSFRAIGRSAAPIMFFLVGFQGTYKFRWQTWCWCLYMFFSQGILNLGIVESTWESMSTILIANLLLKYSAHYLLYSRSLTCALWVLLYAATDFLTKTLRIPYGGSAFQFILCGFFMKRKNKPGLYLLSCSLMISTCYVYATRVYGMYGDDHWFWMFCGPFLLIDFFIFLFFKVKSIRVSEKIERIIQSITNNGYNVYHGHMLYFWVWARRI